MCNDLSFITRPTSLCPPIPVYLPDGRVSILPHQVLSDVLFLPSFRYNLLSISRLSATVCFTFTASDCTLSDIKTRSVLAVGKLHGSLYVLDTSRFSSPLGLSSQSQPCAHSSSTKVAMDNFVLWHNHLGHAYASLLQQLTISFSITGSPSFYLSYLPSGQAISPSILSQSKSCYDPFCFDPCRSLGALPSQFP